MTRGFCGCFHLKWYSIRLPTFHGSDDVMSHAARCVYSREYGCYTLASTNSCQKAASGGSQQVYLIELVTMVTDSEFP